PGALEALEAYDFPGNVRELENILERAMAMCDGTLIEASDLMLPQRGARPAPPDAMAAGGAAAPVAAPPSADGGLDDYISNIERTAIVKALEESRYNKTAAARKL